MRENDYTDPLHALYDHGATTLEQETVIYEAESQCYAYSDRLDIREDIVSTALAKLAMLQEQSTGASNVWQLQRHQNTTAMKTVYLATRSRAAGSEL